MPFLLLFALAGLMAGSAPAVYRLAKDSEVRDRIKRSKEFEGEILKKEIELQDLRDEALRRGIDPALVVRGYEELIEGTVTVGELENLITSAELMLRGESDS